MAVVTICSYFGAQENKICHCFHFFPHLFVIKWWDQMPCTIATGHYLHYITVWKYIQLGSDHNLRWPKKNIFRIDSGEDLCQSTNKNWEHWHCFRPEDRGNEKCPSNGEGIWTLKNKARSSIWSTGQFIRVIYSQGGIEIGWAVIWKHSQLHAIPWRHQWENFIVNLGYGGRFLDMHEIWLMKGLLVSWVPRIYQENFLSLFGD